MPRGPPRDRQGDRPRAPPPRRAGEDLGKPAVVRRRPQAHHPGGLRRPYLAGVGHDRHLLPGALVVQEGEAPPRVRGPERHEVERHEQDARPQPPPRPLAEPAVRVVEHGQPADGRSVLVAHRRSSRGGRGRRQVRRRQVRRRWRAGRGEGAGRRPPGRDRPGNPGRRQRGALLTLQLAAQADAGQDEDVPEVHGAQDEQDHADLRRQGLDGHPGVGHGTGDAQRVGDVAEVEQVEPHDQQAVDGVHEAFRRTRQRAPRMSTARAAGSEPPRGTSARCPSACAAGCRSRRGRRRTGGCTPTTTRSCPSATTGNSHGRRARRRGPAAPRQGGRARRRCARRRAPRRPSTTSS